MTKDKSEAGAVQKFLRAVKDGSAAGSLAKQVGAISPDLAKNVAVKLAEARLAARSIDVAINDERAVFDRDNPWDSIKRLEGDVRAAATIAMKDMDPQSMIKQVASYTGLLPASNTIVDEARKGAKAVANKVRQVINKPQPTPSAPKPNRDINIENFIENSSKPRAGSLLAAHQKANELSRQLLRGKPAIGGRH